MATPASVQARPLAEIPKRVGRPRKFNQELADSILAVISNAGQTATDGAEYDDRGAAMKVSALWKRTVSAVSPDGMQIRTRVFETAAGSGMWNFAVYADTEKKSKK
jgi:hypothetical protein